MPEQKTRPRCGLCGKTERRTCGFAHRPLWERFCPLNLGRLTLALGQLAADSTQPHEPFLCGAACRSKPDHAPCRNRPVNGTDRCRLHGALGGRPPVNGMWTLQRKRDKHFVLLLKRFLPLLNVKPPRVTVDYDPSPRGGSRNDEAPLASSAPGPMATFEKEQAE